LIYALRRSTPREQVIIRRAIENGGREEINEIMQSIESTKAIAYTTSRAREASGQAIDALNRVPDSTYKDALIQLAQFAVDRRY